MYNENFVIKNENFVIKNENFVKKWKMCKCSDECMKSRMNYVIFVLDEIQRFKQLKTFTLRWCLTCRD